LCAHPRRTEPEFIMTVSPPGSSSGSSAASAGSNSVISSNQFLSLLVSELQNQDPLNATSVTDFVNQMTAYNNFTQQQSINSNLGALAGAFSSLVTLNSVNYIGHNVEAKADTAVLTNGSATFGYSLSGAASKVSITVTDSDGNKVWTGTGTGDSGTNTFTWNGKDSSGNQLSDGGKYTVAITATDDAGNSVFNYSTISGVVTGIDTSTGTPSLTVDGVSVSASNIIGVTS
jgi:flagellar basal-body rod modification protein FlgD